MRLLVGDAVLVAFNGRMFSATVVRIRDDGVAVVNGSPHFGDVALDADELPIDADEDFDAAPRR